MRLPPVRVAPFYPRLRPYPPLDVTAKNVGDFRRWKSHDDYQKAFDRLLRDLKGEEGRPPKA